MGALIVTIASIRGRIESYKSLLSRNEMMTRYVLIDPLLRELDWDTSNPSTVAPEDNIGSGRPDYILENNAVVVEAKKLGVNLDNETNKLFFYMRKRGVQYGILTNGQKWKMYGASTTAENPEVEFDVTDSEGIVMSKAIHLHRSVILERIQQNSFAPKEQVKPVPSILRHNAVLTQNAPGISLEDIRYSKRKKKLPQWLLCPNGNKILLDSWIGILGGTAEWLIRNGHITKKHCPLHIDLDKYLIHTSAQHPDGQPFITHQQVDEFCVYIDVDTPTAIQYTKKLIELVGLKLSDFRVVF